MIRLLIDRSLARSLVVSPTAVCAAFGAVPKTARRGNLASSLYRLLSTLQQ
jgi:hypothetical protein